MKKLISKLCYLTVILLSVFMIACTSNSDDNDDITGAGDPTSTTYLTFEKKYNDAITQPTVTLIGDIADDFEVINAGYWESGNSFQFINGVISLQYVGSSTVSPTAVIVRLKDNNGNTMALKIPNVTSFSETSYLLSGGSTFLRNISPLTFQYEETVDLGGGASVTSTVTSVNNYTYAQTTSGKNIVRLVQVLAGNNTSNPDFTGDFSNFSSVELEYFTQTENINNNNAFVQQRYFNSTEINNPTGSFSASAPSYNAGNESWTFSITNNSGQPSSNVGYRFVAQDSNGTTVAFELDTTISFAGNETQQFTINRTDLYNALAFLTNAEVQSLSTTILLEW